MREWVNLENDSDVKEERPVHSIRRQSEGIYAMFHYLNYEQKYKRHHPDWEQRLKKMLDMFLQLQNPDGSFPRKFHDDFTVVDGSGGSTPSATLPLVMDINILRTNAICPLPGVLRNIWKKSLYQRLTISPLRWMQTVRIRKLPSIPLRQLTIYH